MVTLGIEQGSISDHWGHLCSWVGTVISWEQGAIRHKLMHELKYETLLLFSRKLYKLVIKTLMGSWTLKSLSIISKITRRN